MMEKPGFVRDPVCGMQVDKHQYAIQYLEIPYAFCSRQCLERFQAHPHLYVGQPGVKAPRQEDRQVLKKRSLRLSHALARQQAVALAETLTTLPGMRQVRAEGEQLYLIYDLLQSTAEQIEEKLAEVGLGLGQGWADRLRLAFVHYEEELETSALEVNDRL
jgi:YHS domain-containing protein